jgi:formylglycine-generating enzyme required for sulfatase activity
VSYVYKISKYDVTVGQYTQFLNAVAADDAYGLYSTSMADPNIAGIARSGSAGSYTYSVIGSPNVPVTYVSWGDAARFANWIQNGQPTGAQGASTTERGAYKLDGATSAADLLAVKRESDATVFLPSEDEWYKAAYYDPTNDSYYKYGFSSDGPALSMPPGSTPNSANYVSLVTGYALTGSLVLDPQQIYLTDVGAYTNSASPYGAYDMTGNVLQWNESTTRGGSWRGTVGGADSSYRAATVRSFELYSIGFRLAAAPEPSTLTLFTLGGATLWSLRRRRTLRLARSE